MRSRGYAPNGKTPVVLANANRANLKQHVTKAAPARNKIAMSRTAIGSMRSIQKQPQRVKGYFEQKDVCYAAA